MASPRGRLGGGCLRRPGSEPGPEWIRRSRSHRALPWPRWFRVPPQVRPRRSVSRQEVGGALRSRIKKPGPKSPRSVQAQFNTGEQGGRPSTTIPKGARHLSAPPCSLVLNCACTERGLFGPSFLTRLLNAPYKRVDPAVSLRGPEVAAAHHVCVFFQGREGIRQPARRGGALTAAGGGVLQGPRQCILLGDARTRGARRGGLSARGLARVLFRRAVVDVTIAMVTVAFVFFVFFDFVVLVVCEGCGRSSGCSCLRCQRAQACTMLYLLLFVAR